MRTPTLRNFSSGLILILVTAIIALTGSQAAYAQTHTRLFQMALWDYPLPTPEISDAYADIAAFAAQNGPPTDGISVAIGINQTQALASNDPTQKGSWDWARVVAVLVDEPFTPVDSAIASYYGTHPFAAPCDGVQTAIAAAVTIDSQLSQRATELRARNPKARFWVNLNTTEAQLVASNSCWIPVFNRSYMDVISTDWYDADFSTVKAFYDAMSAHPVTPGQQLGLIPGVFSSPTNQLSHLQGFFDYANSRNQTCNLPLGSTGATGVYDRCPVWMVVGWLPTDYYEPRNGQTYAGMLDQTTNSNAIAAVWRQEHALPRAKPKVIQPALQLLVK